MENLFAENIIEDIIHIIEEDLRSSGYDLECKNSNIPVEIINKLDLIDYLERCEVNSEGIIYSPYEEFAIKAFSNNHFGLIKILNFIFSLLYKIMYKEYDGISCYAKVSFDTVQKYLDNALFILSDEGLYADDRIVKTINGVKIYENPKNYSVVDFHKLLPFSEKELRRDYIYDKSTLMVDNGCFVSLKNVFISDNVLDKLTAREKKAFLGEDAIRILSSQFEEVIIKKKN